MFSYRPFWETLKKLNISQYQLIKYAKVYPETLSRIRRGQSLTLNTLNNLCNILHCRIEDIVEHIPDEEEFDE